MSFPCYLDDDSEVLALLRGAAARGWDFARATDVGMRGRTDYEHLAFAAAQGRALVSANIADFYALHDRWLAERRSHAGIILIRQQRWSIGETLRRLEHIQAAFTAEQMVDRLEFLSRWGGDR